MSDQAIDRWRVSQAIRWASDQLDEAGLSATTWAEARQAYTAGDLSERDWRLYDACWTADGTKLSVKEYQVQAAEKYLVRRYIDDGQAGDVEPGATWEQINAPGTWADWTADEEDEERHDLWEPVFSE